MLRTSRFVSRQNCRESKIHKRKGLSSAKETPMSAVWHQLAVDAVVVVVAAVVAVAISRSDINCSIVGLACLDCA
eukprot:SAG31_NODE_820_length_11808_cov_16.331540_7_plen_75_part_00